MQPHEMMTKITLDNWHTHISRTDKLLAELTDEQLMQETAPGKNRGIYLLGHLAAVHDRMLPLLDMGQQQRPEMNDPFLAKPDKAVDTLPTVAELRQYWKDVNTELNKHLAALTPDEWLNKHTSVSNEDFEKEPHRNKLSVLVSRSNHLAYHLGQLVYLKK